MTEAMPALEESVGGDKKIIPDFKYDGPNPPGLVNYDNEAFDWRNEDEDGNIVYRRMDQYNYDLDVPYYLHIRADREKGIGIIEKITDVDGREI